MCHHLNIVPLEFASQHLQGDQHGVAHSSIRAVSNRTPRDAEQIGRQDARPLRGLFRVLKIFPRLRRQTLVLKRQRDGVP